MALSFACHECGEQRTLNADGGADPCPHCGAGLPGEAGEAQDSPQAAEAAAEDAAIDDAATEDNAEDGASSGINRDPLPSEQADAEVVELEDADEGSHPPAPPIAKPPVQASEAEGDDVEEEVIDEIDLSPKGGRQEGDMDMTPMVDVTFLLLIFFMITAAFSLQKSIEIPKPEETDQASTQVREEIEDNTDYITVIIDQYNTFRVQTADSEEEAPGKHDLLRQLRYARDNAPSPDQVPNKLLVKAHGDATHERVVIALDAGVEVGMEQVQLMTVEEDL